MTESKPVVTVLMKRTPTGIYCQGIFRDETIFRLMYVNVPKAIETIGERFTRQGFRCVFDLPKQPRERT